MEDVTLAFALLLAVGLAVARLGALLKLPSVTGYILAGVLLGPSCLNLVSDELSGERLVHFTEIALMLIAFGIGEHIEFKEIGKVVRWVGYAALAETTGAFVVVGSCCYLVAWLTGAGPASWQAGDYLALALLLAAVSVATAPASTLHITQELSARGPLTSTLLGVVAIDNGLAIIYFGVAMALATLGNLSGPASLWAGLLVSLKDIGLALLLGVATGMLIDLVLHRLERHGEMLSAGLALLLLCGELARLANLSSLLAGMAAGCVIVNLDKRDVRLFKALHAFEPPIYILFFTLAGAHLHLGALGVAGWLGATYFFCRLAGKTIGAWLGAKAARSSLLVQRYLGYTLAPQAGVAIGLIFLISSEPDLSEFSAIITPVVLFGVVCSELVGPMLVRFALIQAGEARDEGGGTTGSLAAGGRSMANIFILPWTWRRLRPPARQEGVVLFGAAHHATVPGLARLATIFAHHFQAQPMSIRVVSEELLVENEKNLFFREVREVDSLGYQLATCLVRDDDVPRGLAEAVAGHDTKCLIMGYPIEGTIDRFQQVVEQVTELALCPVVVVRFCGVLHTERILVPLVSMSQLEEISAVVKALLQVGEHSITLLLLLPYNHQEQDVAAKEEELGHWLAHHKIVGSRMACKVMTTDARLATIKGEAELHDLVVMAAPPSGGKIQRLIFGSLADSVAQQCDKPMLIVHNPRP
ncbi:MAG: cation:proton antiporter [Thermodesulfobacteriota bacterium]